MRLWKLMLDPFLFPLRPEMLMSEPNTGSKAKCSMQLKSLWQMFVYIVLLFAPRNAKGIWQQYQRFCCHVPIISIAWLCHAKEHATLSKWPAFITHLHFLRSRFRRNRPATSASNQVRNMILVGVGRLRAVEPRTRHPICTRAKDKFPCSPHWAGKMTVST